VCALSAIVFKCSDKKEAANPKSTTNKPSTLVANRRASQSVAESDDWVVQGSACSSSHQASRATRNDTFAGNFLLTFSRGTVLLVHVEVKTIRGGRKKESACKERSEIREIGKESEESEKQQSQPSEVL
jgi:hypothetical protein